MTRRDVGESPNFQKPHNKNDKIRGACVIVNVMVPVFDDVAFARVAVVDATFVILPRQAEAASPAFPFLAATTLSAAPSPYLPSPSSPLLPSTSLFVLSAHSRSTLPSAVVPAHAPPTRETPPAGKEWSGQRARKEENWPPRRRAAGSGGQSAALCWASGENWPELRAGAARSLRGGGGDGESPLIGCLGRRPGLRRRVLVGTAGGRPRRLALPPAAVVLLPLPVLLQQIRPRLPRAAALQQLPPRPPRSCSGRRCTPPLPREEPRPPFWSLARPT